MQITMLVRNRFVQLGYLATCGEGIWNCNLYHQINSFRMDRDEYSNIQQSVV